MSYFEWVLKLYMDIASYNTIMIFQSMNVKKIYSDHMNTDIAFDETY